MINNPYRSHRIQWWGWPPLAWMLPVMAELMRPSSLWFPPRIQLAALWDLFIHSGARQRNILLPVCSYIRWLSYEQMGAKEHRLICYLVNCKSKYFQITILLNVKPCERFKGLFGWRPGLSLPARQSISAPGDRNPTPGGTAWRWSCLAGSIQTALYSLRCAVMRRLRQSVCGTSWCRCIGSYQIWEKQLGSRKSRNR